MIASLDHLVLTVADIEASVGFYITVLGMERVSFANGRTALAFGRQKINLHLKDHEFEPKAKVPQPGSADLCFVAAVPLATVQARLAAHDIAVEAGPVPRTGAMGPILSVYVRDPDANLIEICTYALENH